MGWFKRDAAAESAGAAVTIIARGQKLSGQVNLDGKLHIDGCFEGQLRSQDSITIGRRGEVRGVVQARQISVSGLLDAEIHCDELNVERDGRVRGVVHSRQMTIHKRGCFIGERALTADSSLMTPGQLEQLHPDSVSVTPSTVSDTAIIELPAAPPLPEGDSSSSKPDQESAPSKEGQLTQMLEQMLGEVPTVGDMGAAPKQSKATKADKADPSSESEN
ncbi:polymer-forming cytoskeletal protein [Motiliproteus coralliicola]|uniref:Polymer-forming cytoskeletal protein n=1 Tax=Motiliproteus coralliicola TaxID=2283196 RepID=A0A369WS01_9GAMM|nr:polymer-forming cytoskeletal protein [Motiliproteus coralliicola]RDE24900.1 polymer-forming cytoskeletal protein [Motiliproteus coralliicola]